MALAWRLAASLDKLRDQVNAAYPTRSKVSDGTIGDAAHAASKSEHNPDSNGVVRALDLTHDPAHGLNAGALAERLRASRDPRILYIISNARIASSYAVNGVPAWTWRPYSGTNAHRSHVHVSVVESARLYDSVRPWSISPTPTTPQEDDVTPEQIKDAVRAVLHEEIVDTPYIKSNPEIAVVTALSYAGQWSLQARDRVSVLTAQIVALPAALARVVQDVEVDVDVDVLAAKIVADLVARAEDDGA